MKMTKNRTKKTGQKGRRKISGNYVEIIRIRSKNKYPKLQSIITTVNTNIRKITLPRFGLPRPPCEPEPIGTYDGLPVVVRAPASLERNPVRSGR